MTYTNFETMPLVLGVIDIADTLAIGRNKAYELVNSGAIQSIKVGQHYRISREAFIDFLKKGGAERINVPRCPLLRWRASTV